MDKEMKPYGKGDPQLSTAENWGQGRQLHGYVPQNDIPLVTPALNKFNDFGNWLRYGLTEEERMELINRGGIPGVEDALPAEERVVRGPSGDWTTAQLPVEDPAARERYNSAYLYAKRWPALSGVGQAITKMSRTAGSKLGIKGLGKERPELEKAMQLGMGRGATETLSKEIEDREKHKSDKPPTFSDFRRVF